MVKLFFASFLLISAPAYAANDKLLHFLGSAVATAVTYELTDDKKLAIAVRVSHGT